MTPPKPTPSGSVKSTAIPKAAVIAPAIHARRPDVWAPPL